MWTLGSVKKGSGVDIDDWLQRLNRRNSLFKTIIAIVLYWYGHYAQLPVMFSAFVAIIYGNHNTKQWWSWNTHYSPYFVVCFFRSRQKSAWAKGRISPQLHLLFYLILYHCVLFVCCNTLSFFPFQASLIMYELAWKMSKDSNDLLWWAAIGLTHQYLYEKIDRYLGRYYFKVHPH